ncbi:MAG: divergent polysaccharide deacetylase family protein [Desulfobacterales bacterium]|jgi:polysaccharide deacetylase 2 family uncharacterized protein YibQ
MAKRKQTRKKTRPKKTRKKTSIKNSLYKAFAGLAILAVLVAAIGFLIYKLAPPQKSLQSSSISKLTQAKKPPVSNKPAFEIYPKEKTSAGKPLAKIDIPKSVPEIKPAPIGKIPRVALIIDDLGYDNKMAQKFLALNINFTVSILPYSPFQNEIARLATSKGLEIMLHLPMEPVEYPEVDPGPGTLLSSMSPDELISKLEENLNTLPSVKGVNNHMGSKLTAESTQMYQIFSVLKHRGLFFIDSRTTPDSLGKPSARLFQVPFAQRDVFIDHYHQPEFMRKQIQELIRIAKINGEAVGILHPHSTTYRILQEMLPDLQKQVQLVPASKIARPVG